MMSGKLKLPILTSTLEEQNDGNIGGVKGSNKTTSNCSIENPTTIEISLSSPAITTSLENKV